MQVKRHGSLIRMRRDASATALLCAALVLSGSAVMLPPRVAEARLDPIRIITSQLVRPNILVVLDTSGSMAQRPDTANFPSDIVGGDCYKGQSCTTVPQSELCADGTGCTPANVCSDGTTACGAGQCPGGG